MEMLLLILAVFIFVVLLSFLLIVHRLAMAVLFKSMNKLRSLDKKLHVKGYESHLVDTALEYVGGWATFISVVLFIAGLFSCGLLFLFEMLFIVIYARKD